MAPPATFFLALGSVHVQGVIGDYGQQITTFAGVVDPVDHLVGGAILLASTQIADRMDRIELALTGCAVTGTAHLKKTLDEYRCQYLAKTDILHRDHF